MKTTAMPAMKPVLVDTVSDDIRNLREDDVSQQKVVLTARAIADIWKCDIVNESNSSDAGFYVDAVRINQSSQEETVRVADLNKVIYGSRRALEIDGYCNGPNLVNSAAFLETYSVLPDGRLTWVTNNAPVTIPAGQNQNTAQQPYSPHLRQVFWTSDQEKLRDDTVYTRVGRYVGDEEGHSPGDYEWSAWLTLNNEILHVVITESTNSFTEGQLYTPEHPLVPSIQTAYEIYTDVPYFILPKADQFKLGQKIFIYQFPAQSNPDGGDAVIALSSTGVSYTERYYDTGAQKIIENPMILNAIPSVERNVKTINDIVKTDHLVGATYEFEVVALVDSANIELAKSDDPHILENESDTQTWELLTAAEETDYLAGIGELLNEHTDNYLADMVQYKRRRYNEEKAKDVSIRDKALQSETDPIIINRVVSTSGYCKLDVFVQHTNRPGWSVQVRVADVRTEAKFNKVDIIQIDGVVMTTPLEEQIYYIKNGLKYELALSTDMTKQPGYITEFLPDTEYYTLGTTHTIFNGNPICTLDNSNTSAGHNMRAVYVYRKNILQIVISPGSVGHIDLRDGADGEGIIVPTVSFYPDPHYAYISKADLNPSAFTEKMVTDLQEAGVLPTDLGEDKMTYPVATSALLEAYGYLAHQLQGKGRLFGAVAAPENELIRASNFTLNNYKDEGDFWICPYRAVGTGAIMESTTYPVAGEYFRYNETTERWESIGQRGVDQLVATDYPNASTMAEVGRGVASESLGWPQGFVNADARLIVLTDKRATADMIKEDELIGDVQHHDVSRVTQFLLQTNRGRLNIWYRFISKNSDGSWGSWSSWTHQPMGEKTINVVDYLNDNVPASKLEEGLRTADKLIVRCGRSDLLADSEPHTVTVNLPSPANYPAGITIVLDYRGNAYTSLKTVCGSYEYVQSIPAEFMAAVMGKPNDYFSLIWKSDGSKWSLVTYG